MSIDDIEEVLEIGSEAEILAAVRSTPIRPLAYAYIPDIRKFCVTYGKQMVISHEMPFAPRCTEYFGEAHAFS